MNEKRYVLKRKDYILFLAAVAASTFLMLFYYVLKGKGLFFISDDFNNQMLPFLVSLRRALNYGLDTYSWDIDLGTSTIQAYAYYGLGSPFFWILCLIKEAWLPYFVWPVFILKYLAAALFSLLFLKRFVDDERYAMIGALLYAFSGFQTVNLVFYHFHDAVAFFPLLLIGLENIMQRKKSADYLFFIFAVFINCITNYYFFVQDIIILFIYFLFRFVDFRKITVSIKKVPQLMACGILGIGMAMPFFLPGILYILNNRRSGGEENVFKILFDLRHLLFILKGFLLPAEAMMDNSILLRNQWDSASCFLPFVGMAAVIAYILKKRDRLSGIILFLVIISFSPLCNAAFVAFSIVYQRWWYFPVLMMAIASSRVLENYRMYPIGKGIAVQTGLLALLTGGTAFINYTQGEAVFHGGRYAVKLAAVLLCSAVFLIMTKRFRKENKVILYGTMSAICLTAVITGFFIQAEYRKGDDITPEKYQAKFNAAYALPGIEDQYRYRNYDNTFITVSPAENTTGLWCYSSTAANVLQEFDDLFDYYKIDARYNKNRIPGCPELLGGKYQFSGPMMEGSEFYPETLSSTGKVISEFTVGDSACFVREMDACPIGYTAERYILLEDLKELELQKRGIALLSAVVLAKEDEPLAAGKLSRITTDEIEELISRDSENTEGGRLFLNAAIKSLTDKNSERVVEDFKKDYKGFSCIVDRKEDSFVYFSIPADEGWQITIDGEKAEFINSGGMILLPVDAGRHEVKAGYATPGFHAGVMIGIAAWLLFAVLSAIVLKRKAK